MIRSPFFVTLAFGMIFSGASAIAQTPVAAVASAPLQTGAATLVREYKAPEAGQGAAADARYLYAITNARIAKYDKTSGARLAEWAGPNGRRGPIRHINSCFAEPGSLWCANSNFPEVPMGSSIERFDTRTMTHMSSHSLGMLDEGSLTFFDRLGSGWIAGFAHYDENGGVAFKNHRFAGIATYDAEWRRTGGWLIPDSVLARMAPHAASGGAIGPDGLLYLMGHDRPEIYALAKPRMGPVLVHLATFDIAAEGQAFAWDKSAPRRIVAISRPTGVIRAFDLPAVTLSDPNAMTFRTSKPR